ncbi:MAG TPA: SRPBCC family protein [Candidatus Acidoferrum sp.]|nr:SRPBCC family protein [Candidatus Acidoferrum sp.]
MAIIHLSTIIEARRERIFDLARSIDAHQESAKETGERAISGVIKGLVGMNDEVTWEARHFGIRQKLTVRITAFDRPNYFQDVMVRGAFRRMVHDHTFVEHPSGTEMVDRFEFGSPFGILGWTIDRLFLCQYMRGFLIQRNLRLKQLAESEEWRRYLQRD